MTTPALPRATPGGGRPTPPTSPLGRRRPQLKLALEEPHPDWPLLDCRDRGTHFLGIPVKSVLNSPAATGMSFWSLNPYIGCEFGCSYCYARDTHRWAVERALKRGGATAAEPQPDHDVVGRQLATLPPAEAFERFILVKTGAPEVLAKTLSPERLERRAVVIGTATDPYQPAERRFRVTRRVLETLAGFKGLTVGIITKSALVVRDLDLMTRIAGGNDLSVNISLMTIDAQVVRQFEHRTPAPHTRLRALAALTGAGIYAGLLIAPVLPGVTDGFDQLSRLMGAAKEAGARYVVGLALRLGPTAKSCFLPVLHQVHPELLERYRRHFEDRVNASRDYARALAERVRALQVIHGFPMQGGR